MWFSDSTAIGDWSLIEPAVEVFSACLPTLTPFLNMHIQWKKIRSSLRSHFHSSRNAPPDGHDSGRSSNEIIGDRREADRSESKRELVLEDMFANDARTADEESRNTSQEGSWLEKREDIERG